MGFVQSNMTFRSFWVELSIQHQPDRRSVSVIFVCPGKMFSDALFVIWCQVPTRLLFVYNFLMPSLCWLMQHIVAVPGYQVIILHACVGKLHLRRYCCDSSLLCYLIGIISVSVCMWLNIRWQPVVTRKPTRKVVARQPHCLI